jgi:hypothetical protein
MPICSASWQQAPNTSTCLSRPTPAPPVSATTTRQKSANIAGGNPNPTLERALVNRNPPSNPHTTLHAFWRQKRPAAQAASCPKEPVFLPLHACLTPAGVAAPKDAVAVPCNLRHHAHAAADTAGRRSDKSFTARGAELHRRCWCR